MSKLREAIIVRLAPTFPELTFYSFEPVDLQSPAVFVIPDQPFVDFQQAYRSGLAEWRFVLTLLVDRIDDEYSQTLLDDFVDPNGRVVARVREQVGDELSKLTNDFVDVTTGTNYGEYVRGRSKYLIAQIKLTVKA